MKQKDMKTVIAGLIELDLAAVEAYRLAAGACSDGEIKKQLEAFADDHQRHVRDLSGWAGEQGGEAPQELGEVGTIIVGYTKLSSLEDRTAVLAMRGNEELTNGAYASAVRAQAPEALRAILERGFEDERRHITWIREQIRLRGWDQEPEEMRELHKAA